MNTAAVESDLSARTVVPLLAAVAAVLHFAGPGSLGPSPISSGAAWSGWFDRSPVDVAFSVVRLLALATCYHLIAVQLVAIVAARLGRPRLVRLADRFTPPPLRAGARRLAGIGLTAVTTVALPAARAHAEPVSGTALMQVVEPAGGTASITVVPGIDETDAADLDPEPAHGTASVRVVNTDAPAVRSGPAPQHHVSPEAAPSLVEHDVNPPTGGERHHVVRPGDHLWSIAAEALAADSGSTPDPVAVESYWRQLVLANPDLDDPDLVFPGDVITLPPVGHTG